VTVTIVPMTLDHFEGFYRVLDVVARERSYLAFLEAPPIERSRTFVQGNIEKGAPQFVAIDKGMVVGWCDITPIDRPVYAHSGVLGMGLLPAYRGHGHGRALIEAALAAARQMGLTRIELGVYSHNTRAKALYDRTGFATEGIKRKAVRIDGVFRDVIVMAIVDDE
jgi:RimJ/RimL family protein N-acetyltransferase